jgi:hypothetical protein
MKHYLSALACCVLLSFSACKKGDVKIAAGPTPPTGPAEDLKINEMQMVGSHNSYRIRTYQPLFLQLQAIDSFLPASLDPDDLDYTHETLNAQLGDYNMRNLELDIYNDPNGGLFYNRGGLAWVSEPIASGEPELMQPGFKILHIPDIDFMTHHLTFKSALQAIKNWSDAHPYHFPIFINVETKLEALTDAVPGLVGFANPVGYDEAAAQAMDQEIKDIFGADLNRVIKPADIKGTYSTLREAALARNWPKLKDARGKVCFIMQGAAESVYKAGHPSLDGRAMFVYANANSAEAAFVIENGPVTGFNNIQNYVAQGFMVRTRADAGTDEARTGNYTDMNAAFSSGAQIVSTDYYRPDPRAGTSADWTDYKVVLPGGGVARINTVSSPAHTDISNLEE